MPKYDKPLTIEELAIMDGKDIDFSDQPETSEEFWTTARVVMPKSQGISQANLTDDA